MKIQSPTPALLVAGFVACSGFVLGQGTEPGPSPTPEPKPKIEPAKPYYRVDVRRADEPREIKMVKQSFLGVATAPADPSLRAQLGLDEGFGLLVHHIDQGSPAGEALEPHDVLTKFNDQRLVNHEQLAVLVRNAGVAAKVSLTLIRAGKELTVEVALVEKEVPAVVANSPMDYQMRLPGQPNFGFPGAAPREMDAEAIERQLRDWREQMERWEQELRRGPQNLQPPQKEGAEAGPRIRTQAGVTTQTNRMRKSTWVEDGLILNLSDNGDDKTLTIDRDGKRLFEGPINTPEQREKIPEDVRKAVERLEDQLGRSPKIPADPNRDGDDVL